MRGSDERTGSLFSFVDLEERVPQRHPLRKIRQIVNEALTSLDGEFARLYSSEGRPSIAPERPICEQADRKPTVSTAGSMHPHQVCELQRALAPR